MAAPTIPTATTAYQADHKSSQSSSSKAEASSGPSLAAQQKASFNSAILESTQVTIASQDQSLALLLNTAIDKINEILAPELGENAIQKTADSGLDVSPDATAERIVSLSTAFFSAYKEQNPDQDDATVLENFISTISEGIEQGFSEAREILDGLNVLEGDIATNIDETYTLVQEKLAAFESMITDLVTE